MSEWQEKHLNEVADIRVSNVDKKIYPNKFIVRLCNYIDVYTNDYISSKIPFSVGSSDENELLKFGLKKGDVLITKDSETPDDIAVSAVVTEDIENLVCGYHLAILRPDENKIDGKFLMQRLKGGDFKSYFLGAAKGSTRFGLTIGDIEQAKIKYPSLPIQRRIAAILSTCDAVIEKTQAAIDKYKSIKQGMLHDLFRRGVVSEKVKVKSKDGEWGEKEVWKLRPRFEDAPELYKESKLGWIPKEWEVETIGSWIIPIMSNVDKHIREDETMVRLCNYMDVYSNRYLTKELSFSFGSVNFTEIQKFLLQPQDVIITKDSETPDDIGVPSVLVGEIENLICGYHLCILRSKDLQKLNGEFIMLQLQTSSVNNQFAIRANGSTRFGLTIDVINEIFLKIPRNINEQLEIVKRLFTIDTKLQTEQTYLEKMQQLKKGLMDDLLSEKVKVKVEESITQNES